MSRVQIRGEFSSGWRGVGFRLEISRVQVGDEHRAGFRLEMRMVQFGDE